VYLCVCDICIVRSRTKGHGVFFFDTGVGDLLSFILEGCILLRERTMELYTITIYKYICLLPPSQLLQFFIMYLTTCFGSYEPSSGEVRVYKCYGIRCAIHNLFRF
jgi:hypothetical protein